MKEKEQTTITIKTSEKLKHIKKLKAQQLLCKKKEHLATKILHDIKAPLTALEMHLNSLISNPDKICETQETVQIIKQIVKEYNTPRELILKKRFEVFGVLEKTINVLQPLLKKEDIKITIRCDPRIFLTGSPIGFNRVILNLINNSAEAFEEAASKKLIDIKCFKNKANLVLKIQDNGKGMTENQRKKIFLQHYTTKKFKNNQGLGLANCKEIIEHEFGGKIEVTSSLGKGTMFSIIIPTHGGLVEW